MVVDAGVQTMAPALWVHRGRAPHMARPHRHDDLELNAVFSGRLEYQWAGARVSVDAGSIGLFWGATPHRLVDGGREPDDDAGWVHVPLTTVLSWALPEGDVAALLGRRPLVVPAECAGQDVAAMIDRWRRDVDGGDETRRVATLEAEAVVRRLLRAARERADDDPEHPGDDGSVHAAELARYLAANFREPLGPEDIAREVHLHPRYAMTLFRRLTGMTVGAYLVRCRIAEAQRLLITTSMTTRDIARESGFGSQSSLYAHFAREVGVPPGRYRRTR